MFFNQFKVDISFRVTIKNSRLFFNILIKGMKINGVALNSIFRVNFISILYQIFNLLTRLLTYLIKINKKKSHL